ncbi:uncharacterized protein LOC135946404 [Cloeon dipterum]|uniref:uncharacterized protein LOC135946404 n=1 Tax=Cloeon dipterum TaxID=197152 RepID=UPI00321FDCAA
MKWSTTLFGVVLCLCALAATRVQGQTNATDASPGEFPYVVSVAHFEESVEMVIETQVNLNVTDKTYSTSVPGLVVSSRNLSNMQIIDQQGKVRAPIKIMGIYYNTFVYIKFCDNFRGTKFPLTASSFNDLSANVSATLIFFNGTSHVLKKVAATAFDSETCENLESNGGYKLCMKKDDTPGLCKIFFDSASNPTYKWIPMLAIDGQVQGAFLSFSCADNGDMSDKWLFRNIDSYRQELIQTIPIVDIK